MKADIEHYTRLNSILHRWDARWKIVSLTILIFTSAVLQHIQSAFISLMFCLLILFSGSLPLRYILARLGVVNIFLIPCFIVLPFTVPGVQIHVLGMEMSRDGLILASTLYLRAVAIVAASMALIFSTPMTRLLRAAEQLRCPKVLIQIALLTYRYIFTLTWEFNRIRWALTTRGFQNRTALRSYKTLANVVGLTLIHSLERTERIYRAMQCRGYDGTLRTLHSFSTQPADVIKSILCVSFSFFLIWYDYNIPF